MTQWYYSDSERNRHGPLDDAGMIERHQRGELTADTLIWRDGLSQWRPWRELAGELIADAGFAAPSPEPVETAGGARTAAAIVAAVAEAEERADPRAAPAAAIAAADPTHSGSIQPAQAAATTASAADSAYGRTNAEPDSPYTAPRAGVAEDTQVVQGLEVVYAGFWRRMAAYMIDSLLITIAYYAISTVLFGLVLAFGVFGGDATAWARTPGAVMALMLGVVYSLIGLLSLCYYVGFESSAMQATLGKLAVGIKVVDHDGRRLTRARALGRWGSSLLSYMSFFVGFLLIAFTDRKRGLHDMIAKTQVVDRWAYTARPEMQRRDLGPVAWVVLIMGGLMWLLVAGVAAFGAFSAAMGR